MFDDNNNINSTADIEAPAPPAPPTTQPPTAGSVVEPPPPTSESPHMDLPLTPKAPSTNKHLKVIIASIAGLVLLGGIGYGGWWVYQNPLEGNFSNITRIFSKSDEQQPADEVAMEDDKKDEEVMMEDGDNVETGDTSVAGELNFNEIHEIEDMPGNLLNLNSSITINDEQGTFDLNLDFVLKASSADVLEEIRSDLSDYSKEFQELSIELVSALNPNTSNPEIPFIEIENDNRLQEINNSWPSIEMLSSWYPDFYQGFSEAISMHLTLAKLHLSAEISGENVFYPVIRFSFDDLTNNVTIAVYDADRNSETKSIIFSELMTDPEDQMNKKRVSDIKQIQTALELRYVDNDGYPISDDKLILNNTYQLCDNGFVSAADCEGTVYMGKTPQDPGEGEYAYRSLTGDKYELTFELSEDTGGLSAGLNLATQNGITSLGEYTDTDADGLSDELELENGTDINEPDTDTDGVSDYDEVVWWKTDPLNWDSDGDEFGDGQEIYNGYNPLGEGRLFQ